MAIVAPSKALIVQLPICVVLVLGVWWNYGAVPALIVGGGVAFFVIIERKRGTSWYPDLDLFESSS